MPALIIIGAQWGDEGKGKVVDLLGREADTVVRYAGGPNAGHTLVVDGDRMVFRLVPSGVLHPDVRCVLGAGMVVNPDVLLEEIDTLAGKGVSIDGRLHLSDRAHLLLPHHVAVDGLRENAKSGTKIGTTKRGIGPCYEDKAGRRGLRVGDLRDLAAAGQRLRETLAFWQPVAAALEGSLPDYDECFAPLERAAERLLPLATDAAAVVERELKDGKRLMLEGAQGTLLDLDHGTYPFVTSSSSIAGGACTGAGIGPTRIDRVIGITKAYTTRVGAGPFPTELEDDTGKHLQKAGHEFGSVTGRPRRTGWLDLAALRYTSRVNGLDGLALTKLDVLSGLESLKVCVGYDTPGGRSDAIPLLAAESATPVYETLEGWSEDISEARSLDDLPPAARSYVDFIEQRLELPIYLVSVGPARDATIVLRDAFG
jgi:adenylosuccinate synthase